MATFIQGKPCLNCGGTKRYASGRNCATCKKVLTPAQKQAAKLQQAEWRKNNREHHLRHRRTSRYKIYGLNETGFDALMVAQGGNCPGCGTKLLADKATNIDHDHATGKVRGLLCMTCNIALGLVKDSVEILLSLGVYLEKHRG